MVGRVNAKLHWCDRVVNPALQLLLSDSCLLLIIRPTFPSGLKAPSHPVPPSKVMLFATSPCRYSLCRSLVPSYNSSKSHLLSKYYVSFTFPFSCKNTILACSVKDLHTKHKSTVVSQRLRFQSTFNRSEEHTSNSSHL